MQKAWPNPLLQIVLLSCLVTPVAAAVPTEKAQKENLIKSAVQDIFSEHGYSIEKENVVLIQENGKVTVAMDVSNSIASTLSDEILDRIVGIDLALLDTTLEMNMFGAAIGTRDADVRKNAINPRFDDALSTVKREVALDKELGEKISSPVMVTSEGLWSVPQNSGLEKARSIILVHLLKIRESGQMLSTVLMENYWKDVFRNAGAADLYEVARPLVSQALVAGVKPYREGGSLNATVFADLALSALGMEPVRGTGASVILFRP